MKEKGITLIALVITIIVLLILAGVTIATLAGENGIIKRADEATEKTKEANAEEQVKLAVLGSKDTQGKLNNEDLRDNLNQIEKIEGVKLLLVHGSPRRNNEDILPDTPPKEVEEMVKDTDATIILCGHTHIPCGFQTVTRKTVINVGSVGRPFTEQPKSCYLILDINDGKFTIEHKFVRYDNKKAADILAQRTFEGADKLSQVLINPTERHF